MAGPIHDSEILHRGVKKAWLQWNPDTCNVDLRLEAFLLRKDEAGVTVDRAEYVTVETTRQFGGHKPRFPCVVALTASEIRFLGLDVVPKAEDPNSAEITGLPPNPHLETTSDEEAKAAVALALSLCQASRFVIPPSDSLLSNIRQEYEDDRT